MKKSRKIGWAMLSIIGTFLFLGCNSDTEKKNALHLNKGQQWEVNKEMRPAIEKGNAIIKRFIVEKDTNYRLLADKLKAQNNKLIQSCTMSGESHNMLHHWLHPHMEKVDDLGTAKDYASAKVIISQLEQSFKTYHTYFK